jgi:hypothetical protein
VIKAYVEKQRRTPQKMVEKPKAPGTVDIGALWNDPDAGGDTLQAGRIEIYRSKKKMVLATAAPAMQ